MTDWQALVEWMHSAEVRECVAKYAGDGAMRRTALREEEIQ